MRLAIDTMGGDYGPKAVVKGIIEAKRSLGGNYLLFGDESEITRILGNSGEDTTGIEVVPATETIEMTDHAVSAVKNKRDSSMVKAVLSVKEGLADGVISTGNTGAVVAAALLNWGRIKGVERPGIATPMPTARGYSVLCDAGASVDSRPRHLVDFALMASIYAEEVLEIERPKVGLLSNGKERQKGNELTREAYPLLEKAPVEFIGYIEGGDIWSGRADVVVCDGFVGNVALKCAETLAKTIKVTLRQEMKRSLLRAAGGLLGYGGFRAVAERFDHSGVGGAPLLGVRQPCFISHGSSTPKAIRNAVKMAGRCIERGINDKIREKVELSHSARPGKGGRP